MAFPAQFLFTVLETSVRWQCNQTQIVDWSISDGLDLVAAFKPVRFGDETAAGLMSVAPGDIRPLFRPFGGAARKVHVQQARLAGSADWKTITKPAGGVKFTATDIMITVREIERFEDAHGFVRNRQGGPGTPAKYDWEGFNLAVLKRLFLNGFPEKQKDLIDEMEEWFITNSPHGEAPDESTIRRRIQAIWKELKMV